MASISCTRTIPRGIWGYTRTHQFNSCKNTIYSTKQKNYEAQIDKMKSHALQPNNKKITVLHALLWPIYNCKISPTFALGYESFALQLFSKLASTHHSPVAMDKIQNTLAISAPGNDTIEAGTQLFYSKT